MGGWIGGGRRVSPSDWVSANIELLKFPLANKSATDTTLWRAMFEMPSFDHRHIASASQVPYYGFHHPRATRGPGVHGTVLAVPGSPLASLANVMYGPFPGSKGQCGLVRQ